MFMPLTVALVSARGLGVFLVARSSFLTWATASITPLNKRTLNRIRFISDVVPFSREYTTRAAATPAGWPSFDFSNTGATTEAEMGRKTSHAPELLSSHSNPPATIRHPNLHLMCLVACAIVRQ